MSYELPEEEPTKSVVQEEPATGEVQEESAANAGDIELGSAVQQDKGAESTLSPPTPKTKVTLSKRGVSDADKQELNAQYAANWDFRKGIVSIQSRFRGRKEREKTKTLKDNAYNLFESEILEKSPIRDMMFFGLFLLVFSMAVFYKVDPDSHYFVRIMDDWVVQEEFSMSDAAIYKNFGSIASNEEFWQYMKGPFAGNMFPEDGHEIFDGIAVVGEVRMRGVRVEDAGESACYIPGMMKSAMTKKTCYLPIDYSKVATVNDDVGAAKATSKLVKDAFQYDSEEDQVASLYEAWKSFYPSTGGYILHLSNNLTNTEVGNYLTEAQNAGWLADNTRAVFIEFAVYDKHTSIFVQVRLLCEFYATGGVGTYPSFEIAKIMSLGSETHKLKENTGMIMRFIVFAFVFCLIVQEIRELKQEGREYFRSLWNYLDLLNYFIFIVQFYFFLNYLVYQAEIAKLLEDENNQKFVDIGYLATLYNYVDWIACVNIFFSYLKIFQYMEASKAMSKLLHTFAKAFKNAIPLLIFLITIVVCFALAFVVGFNNASREIRNFKSACYTLGAASLGMGDGEWETSVYLTNRYVGTFLIIFFKLIVGFVIISMIVTIMDAAFTEVAETFDDEFENDVLVTSFKIKAHEAYVWLHSKFGRRFKMPPPQEKAIAFCHVAKLLDEKKKMGKSDRSLEERLDSIERLLMKERNTLRKVQSKIEA